MRRKTTEKRRPVQSFSLGTQCSNSRFCVAVRTIAWPCSRRWLNTGCASAAAPFSKSWNRRPAKSVSAGCDTQIATPRTAALGDENHVGDRRAVLDLAAARAALDALARFLLLLVAVAGNVVALAVGVANDDDGVEKLALQAQALFQGARKASKGARDADGNLRVILEVLAEAVVEGALRLVHQLVAPRQRLAAHAHGLEFVSAALDKPESGVDGLGRGHVERGGDGGHLSGHLRFVPSTRRNPPGAPFVTSHRLYSVGVCAMPADVILPADAVARACAALALSDALASVSGRAARRGEAPAGIAGAFPGLGRWGCAARRHERRRALLVQAHFILGQASAPWRRVSGAASLLAEVRSKFALADVVVGVILE
eukprot:m.262547 g.262547  ORF g.262547 m.262547 type:complete len:371 (+) comp11048_c0_seq6:745-1857(+)